MAEKNLTEADKYYIINHKHLPIEDLVKSCSKGIGPKTIEKFLNDFKLENPLEDAKTKIVNSTIYGDRHNSGAIVLTKAASELADDGRKNNQKTTNIHRDSIFRPKGK